MQHLKSTTAFTRETLPLSSPPNALYNGLMYTRHTHRKKENELVAGESHSEEDLKHIRRYNNNKNERKKFTLQNQIDVNA